MLKRQRGNAAHPLLFMASFIKPHWKPLGLLLAGNFLVILLAVLMPLIMAPILDIALGQKPDIENAASGGVGLGNLDLSNIGQVLFQWLGITEIDNPLRAVGILALIYALVGLLRGLVGFGNSMLGTWIQVRTARGMQFALFRHLLSLSMRFFDHQRTGALLSRLENDTTAASFGMHVIFTRLLTAPVLIVFYGTLLIRTSPLLAVAAGIVAVLHFGITRGITGPIRRHLKDQFSAIANLSARFQETLLNIRIVKSFAAEEFELRRLRKDIEKVVKANISFGVFKHIEEPARNALLFVSEALVVFLAARELLLGNLNASTFFLFLYVGRAIMAPLGQLATTLTQIQTMLAAASRVFELFAEQPDILDGKLDIGNFEDCIEFQGVTFAYENSKQVLEDIDLTIHRGEVVALVGPSGAGKSTLTDLMLRFYDPTRGRVCIDKIALHSLKLGNYRRLFGVVSQEPLLFNASISDNIVYGREGFVGDDVERAARIANAHEFISALPEGYDTFIGDRGVRLSGGQRQRLAIARAVLGRPPVMIFDEATSSLDSESERLVQNAIERALEGATALIIAHRLSTVLRADKIVVLEDGRIEAVGEHTDLLTSSPTYERLYRLQFGSEKLDY